MKILIVFVLNLIVISLAGAVPKANNDQVDQVFIVANEYQDKLNTLQTGIDNSISTLKNLVGTAIKATSADALDQIETHARKIASDELTVKVALGEHDVEDPCFMQLTNALESATNTIGFALMNYVRSYQKDVSALTKEASAAMQNYDVGVFDHFYDVVVKTFGERNTFMQPVEIENRIRAAFDSIDKDFGEDLSEKVNELLDGLNIAINEKNSDLGKKFSNAEAEIGISYGRISDAIGICAENYENPTARRHQFDMEYFSPRNLYI